MKRFGAQALPFESHNTANITNVSYLNNLIWLGRYALIGDSSDYPGIIHVIYGASDITNSKIKNNIIMTYAGPAVSYSQGAANYAGNDIVENNIFYHQGYNWATGDFNFSFSDDYGYYTIEQWADRYPLVRNNIYAEAKLMDASIDYFRSPENFKFDYLPESPAINLGTGDTQASGYDIRGNPRDSHPDAGPYDRFKLLLPRQLPEGMPERRDATLRHRRLRPCQRGLRELRVAWLQYGVYTRLPANGSFLHRHL